MNEITTTGETWPKQKTLTDGDPLDTAKFLEAFTTSAERAEFLRELLRAGVYRVAQVDTVGDLAGTQALPGQIVQVNGPQPMLFVFLTTVAPQVDGFVYPYVNPGDGSWFNIAWFLASYTAGVVKLDPGVMRVPNAIEEVISTSKLSDTAVTDNGAWQVVHSLNRSLDAGDKVQLRAQGRLSTSDAATALELGWRLRVTAPGGGNTLLGSEVGQLAPWANKKFAISTEGVWTANEAGLHNFALEVQAPSYGGGSYSVTAHAPTSLRGLWIKP